MSSVAGPGGPVPAPEEPEGTVGDAARAWPPGTVLEPGSTLMAVCAGCRAPWRVHENLAGYRFRCEACGGWVEVPRPARETALALEMGRALARSAADPDAGVDVALVPVAELPVDADGLRQLDLPSGRVYEGDIPPDAAMGPGAVRNVRNEVRKRWTTRTALEIAGMLLAILLPQALLHWALSEEQAVVLAPLAAMVGGLGVIAVGMGAPTYTFGGLRRAPLWSWALGLVGAGAALAMAYGWIALVEATGGGDWDMDQIEPMRDTLGVTGLLVVYAASPALFEELAFRGLLQGRLRALMGHAPGLLSTAMLFAAAHGISLGTPLHLSIGVYLGWLRHRCGSLWPGILLHFLYNGTLVVADTW